jgi:hypothetical protein
MHKHICNFSKPLAVQVEAFLRQGRRLLASARSGGRASERGEQVIDCLYQSVTRKQRYALETGVLSAARALASAHFAFAPLLVRRHRHSLLSDWDSVIMM